MNKNKNGMYECRECGKEFQKSGSCALHEYKKHNIKKNNDTEKKEVETDNSSDWVFLGKKELTIGGQTVTLKQQQIAKNDGFMEINIKTGGIK